MSNCGSRKMKKGGAVSPRKQMAMGMKYGGSVKKMKDGGSVGFNTKVYGGGGKPSFRSQYKVQDNKVVKMPADMSKVQTFYSKIK
tara:strand:- start:2313 stop:2567 length:255 start_codon:yes stop_codon:yes gene_type:complete